VYTIRQAATRSGVPVSTIRAWERRYGVVAPPRTGSGYRLYDDEAIRELDAMRRMVAAGMQPSLAAEQLRERGIAAAPGLDASDDAFVRAESGALGPADQPDTDRLIARFVQAAAALDEPAITDVLDDLFARGSFERVASDVLFPALRRLGEAWLAGEVSVAGEHLASHLVQRRLGQLLDAAGTPATTRRRILVGLPPGSRHELGALAFAVAARRAGLPVAYLGADLPLADWLTAAQSARAVVIGVPTAGDRSAAEAVVKALVAGNSGLTVAVGGSGAVDLPGALRLPIRLDDSVSTLSRELKARS